MASLPPPDECYSALGFSRHDPELPGVDVKVWRGLLESNRLEDIRQRTLLRRDQANCALVDEGYVVGSVPPLGISKEETEKLLSSLTEGIARGCQTVADWRKLKAGQPD